MEIGEIQEILQDAATDNEIEISELLSYQIILNIDNYNEAISYMIDDIEREVEIDKNDNTIHITIRLY